MQEKKYCPMCKRTREVEWFSKNKLAADGLQGRCKKCAHKPPKKTSIYGWHMISRLNGVVERQKARAVVATRHRNARQNARYALKTGAIKMPEHCEHPGCTATPTELHHFLPYDDPKNDRSVMCMCEEHHDYIHQNEDKIPVFELSFDESKI